MLCFGCYVQVGILIRNITKNASEPMWFRGVAASVGLCFDFGAALEGHPDVVLAVNGDVRL